MRAGQTAYNFGVPGETGYGYTQAILVGSTLYISGQVSQDMEGNFVGDGDFELQVRTTFSNLDRVLDHYGAGRDSIVQTTVLVKELRAHSADIARLHAEYFGSRRPTSTLLGVVELGVGPQQLVEIAAIAVIPETE
jgi:2-iminobutanoate/2-iminopropanoate deaminase